MDKVVAQVGQIIEVNGKQYRATEGGFERVRGGELKRLDQCKIGQRVTVQATVRDNCILDFDGGIIGRNFTVETNIPPRPTFTPMSAGEAAALPDIVGRWVAVKVLAININCDSVKTNAGIPDTGDEILLIDGVDL